MLAAEPDDAAQRSSNPESPPPPAAAEDVVLAFVAVDADEVLEAMLGRDGCSADEEMEEDADRDGCEDVGERMEEAAAFEAPIGGGDLVALAAVLPSSPPRKSKTSPLAVDFVAGVGLAAEAVLEGVGGAFAADDPLGAL